MLLVKSLLIYMANHNAGAFVPFIELLPLAVSPFFTNFCFKMRNLHY